MDKNLTCAFCDKEFKREANYLKHKCEKMKRHDIFNTVIGRLAYLFFNQWRKVSGYPPVMVDTFTSSKYFRAFVDFAEFARNRAIPDKIGYIEFMVKKTLLPFNWCDYEVYDAYIANFDKQYSIDEKVNISIETLKELSNKYECEISDVFEHVSPLQILKYITSRKLSPWLLLASTQFMEFMRFKTDKEQRLLFNRFIDVPAWKKHFMEHAEDVSEIKAINRQLGI